VYNGLDIKFAPIKQRIIDTSTQDWQSAINNSGRPMTYCKFTFNNALFCLLCRLWICYVQFYAE